MVSTPKVPPNSILQPGRGGAQGELLVDGEVGVVMLGVLGWAFGHFELR